MKAELKRKVAHWQNQLLDLSKRNRMIQFRPTRLGSLDLTFPDCETLFNRIYRKEETLTFCQEFDRHQNPRMYSFLKLFSALDHPIEVSVGEIRAEGSSSEIARTLRNMRSKARLSLEEQGTNILYLCLGFVRWSSPKRSYKEETCSPLLLVPVVLQRATLSAPFTLSRYEDDAVINPTLSYLMQSEFDLELPDFDAEDEPISSYLKKMELFARDHGWELLREAKLGIMSFQKITMYKDIQNNLERIARNPVMLAMAGDTAALPMPEEALPALDTISPRDTFEVLGADSSQQEAILYARKGISFVMQGPPGTGKSQTITNIIAAALADGKKVLFVSEKAAALEVVYKRLCDVQLGDFCLPLHSSKANKREIIERLGKTLERQHFTVRDSELAKLDKLDVERELLNQYAGSLHQTVEPLGMTVYELYTAMLHLAETPEVFFELPGFELMIQSDLIRMEHQLRKYDAAARKLQYQVQNHPWTGLLKKHAGMEYTNTMRTHLSALYHLLAEMAPHLAALEELSVSEEWLRDDPLARLETLSQFALLRYAPEHWFTTGGQEALLDTAEYLRMLAREQGELESSVRQIFHEAAFAFDAIHWVAQWESLKRQLHELSKKLRPETIYPETAERCADLLQVLKSHQKIINETAALLKCPVPLDLKQSKRLISWAEKTFDTVQCRKEWFNFKHHTKRISKVEHLIEISSELTALTTDLESHWQSALLEETLEPLFEKCKTVYSQQSIMLMLSSILKNLLLGVLPDDAIEIIPELDERLENLQKLITEAETSTGIPSELALTDPGIYEKAGSILESTAPIEGNWIDGSTDPSRLRAALDELETISAQHHNQEQRILENWNSQALSFAYKEVLQRYRTEYTSFFKVLRPSWHKDRRDLRSMQRSSKSVSDEAFLQYLISMEEKQETEEHFSQKTDKVKDLFGEQYHSFDSPWQEIGSGIALSEALLDLFGSVPLEFAQKAVKERHALRTALHSAAEGIKEATEKINPLFRKLLLNRF